MVPLEITTCKTSLGAILHTHDGRGYRPDARPGGIPPRTHLPDAVVLPLAAPPCTRFLRAAHTTRPTSSSSATTAMHTAAREPDDSASGPSPEPPVLALPAPTGGVGDGVGSLLVVRVLVGEGDSGADGVGVALSLGNSRGGGLEDGGATDGLGSLSQDTRRRACNATTIPPIPHRLHPIVPLSTDRMQGCIIRAITQKRYNARDK